MQKKINLFLFLLMGFIYFSGCSLDYQQDLLVNEMEESIPDSIIYSFEHTAVENGVPLFRLFAEEAALYGEKKRTELSDVQFYEFNKEGEIVTEGTADEAVIFTESEDAELTGDLQVYSLREEAEILCDYMYWNNEQKLLETGEEYKTDIKRDSGSTISGYGFQADMRRWEIIFIEGVTGTYILDEE